MIFIDKNLSFMNAINIKNPVLSLDFNLIILKSRRISCKWNSLFSFLSKIIAFSKSFFYFFSYWSNFSSNFKGFVYIVFLSNSKVNYFLQENKIIKSIYLKVLNANYNKFIVKRNIINIFNQLIKL